MPAFEALVEGFLAPYDRPDELEEPRRRPRWPRDGGAAPRPEENRFGAWRRHAGLQAGDYLGALSGDVAGLRLALVREGFGIAGLSEADVDEAVREAAHAFERLGAKVEEVSIPWHKDAMAVWNAIAVEGPRRSWSPARAWPEGSRATTRPGWSTSSARAAGPRATCCRR